MWEPGAPGGINTFIPMAVESSRRRTSEENLSPSFSLLQ